MKIRMYKEGMYNWQITKSSIEDALKCRPEFNFVDKRLQNEYPLNEAKQEEPESSPEPSKGYESFTNKEKKDYLENVARQYGVEIDKRQGLEKLEKIVEDLMES